MPQTFDRSLRISELLRRELSSLLQNELKDPRVQGVLITEVRTTRNLAFSRIYVRTIGDADEKSVIDGLTSSVGFLRGRLGSVLDIKKVPELTFIFDRTAEQGERIEALLREAEKQKR